MEAICKPSSALRWDQSPLNALMSMAKTGMHRLDAASREASIAALSRETFVERWRVLVGEPPAAMLECRREMLALLVESVPVGVDHLPGHAADVPKSDEGKICLTRANPQKSC